MHDDGSSFSQALTDAKNRLGPDTIMLGSDSTGLTTPGGFLYDTPIPNNTVAIIGAGGRNFGQTRTSLSLSGSPNAKTVLTVTGTPGSTISGIDVVVAPGANTGIHTDGAVSNVAIEATTPPGDSADGITLEDGGALIDSDVSLPTDAPQTIGVFEVGANTSVDRSTIRASHAIQTSNGAGGAILSGAVRRSEIVSSAQGIEIHAGSFVVEDTLLRTATDLPLGGHSGVGVDTQNGDNALALNHVTMVGTASSGLALTASASGGHSAGLTIRNSVLSGYGSTFHRNAFGGGAANISTDYSDYTGPTDFDSGPGAITETNHLTADPGFLSSTDFHLRSDSPLIDAGDPAGLGAGESTTDASGQPRLLDGGGDCVARRDVGAFEFQPGPRAPRAAASATPSALLVGAGSSFDAISSCDPDGDSLSFAWAFDDGATATGATVQHAFATPGNHFGTVTVADSTGRTATATAAVVVTAPPPPPPGFPGVAIKKQSVRVSKKGAAPVKVLCPASTAGACTGTLKLLGGSAKFTIPAATTKKVTVKLAKAKLGTLRKKKRLTATATGVARDAAGATKTTHGRITLLSPR
ncbi:MAG: hypothetical protein QOC77_1225 [Thermoleophilaceae bacterium]|nr:hypothetical protein [Thermoleophilaceae bacterium]